MNESGSVKCLNCGEQASGKFCWNCGQKTTVGRLHIKEILIEFFLSPFHIENHGLFWTFSWLFTQPGEVIRNYVHGERKLLYPAFRYLVLGGTIATIIAQRYEIFHADVIMNDAVDDAGSSMFEFLDPLIKIFNSLFDFIDPGFFVYVNDNLTIVNLFAIPVFATFTFLFFRPKGYNYAENLTLQAYITSQQLWTLIVIFPLLQFLPGIKDLILQAYTVFTTLYYFYVVLKFFNMWSILGFILILLSFIYSYIVQFSLTYGIYSLFGQSMAAGH